MKRRLNKKHKAFIYYKARGYNNADSILKAGYKSKDRIQASKYAYELLQKQEIKDAIVEEKLEVFDVSMINDEYVLSNLKEIVKNANKNSDKINALSLIGKALGLFIDRQEVKSDISVQQEDIIQSYINNRLQDTN